MLINLRLRHRRFERELLFAAAVNIRFRRFHASFDLSLCESYVAMFHVSLELCFTSQLSACVRLMDKLIIR